MQILLEKTGGQVSALQSALSNHISVNYQNGFAKGYLNNFDIFLSSSNAISINTGLVQIQGFRVQNDSIHTITFPTLFNEPTIMQLVAILNITSNSMNSTCVFENRTVQSLRKDNIFSTGAGIYQLELAQFTVTPTGITNLKKTIAPLDFSIFNYSIDNATTVINHTLELNANKAFAAKGIKSVNIIIPSTAGIGFSAGVDIESGSSPPSIKFVNNSAYPFKIIYRTLVLPSYTPSQNVTVNMTFLCEGINITCDIREVPK